MLTLRVHVGFGDALRMVGVIVDQAKDVTPILRRWGGWLRADAKQHFQEQPGWAPLAESTRERLEHTRTSAVTAAGNVRKSYESKAAAQIRGRLRKGVINSSTQLAELRRLSRGGSTSYSLQAGQRRQGAAVDRLRRQLAKAQTTGKRVGGDKRAIEKHNLLGKLASSIGAKAQGLRVVVESAVAWSRVHNEGGTVGHGAAVPERRFLEITQEAVQALAQIALDHLLGKKG